VLEVDRRRKRTHVEDARGHVAPNNGYGPLFDKFANIMVLNADVRRLRGGHVVGGE